MIIFKRSTLTYKIFPKLTEFYISKLSASRLDKLFFDICNKFSIINFIDCGANIGATSFKANKMGFNTIAIEPNPIAFKKIIMKSNNKFTKINIGLSDKVTVLKLNCPEHLNIAGYSTFLQPSKKHKHFKKLIKNVQIEVPITTLDHLNNNLKFTNQHTALWIDVEGMQKEVLTGGKDLIKNKNCKVIKIEIEKNNIFKNQSWYAEEIENYLISKGYKTIFRDFEYSNSFNIILIKKKDKHLLENEINKAINDVYEYIGNASFFKVVKHNFHEKIFKNFLKFFKNLIIKIFGLKVGNIIASAIGSETSSQYLKDHNKD